MQAGRIWQTRPMQPQWLSRRSANGGRMGQGGCRRVHAGAVLVHEWPGLRAWRMRGIDTRFVWGKDGPDAGGPTAFPTVLHPAAPSLVDGSVQVREFPCPLKVACIMLPAGSSASCLTPPVPCRSCALPVRGERRSSHTRSGPHTAERPSHCTQLWKVYARPAGLPGPRSPSWWLPRT